MDRPARWMLLGIILLAVACGDDGEGGAPSATATRTATVEILPPVTASPIPTGTATPAPSPSATLTATAAPSPSPSATFTATPVLRGAMALFSRDALDPANPFPSDRLLDSSGHVRISAELMSAILPADARYDTARGYFEVIAEQLSDLTGFSTYAPLRVPFDGTVVAPQGDSLPGVLVLRYDDLAEEAPVEVVAVTPEVGGDDALEIYPVLPLREETRYVYVITTAVRDGDGDPVRPSPALQAALRDDPELADWRAALEPVLDHLESRNISLDDIAVIDFFTTQPITADLVAIQRLLHDGSLPAGQPAFADSSVPGLVTGIFPEGSPEFTELVGRATSPALAAVAVGSFPSFDFRYGPQMPFDARRVSGEVVPTVNQLDFYLTIPKAPAPPEGYPITIFGHGLGGSGLNAIRIGETFGDTPMMVIGISDVEHGRRGNVSNFFNLIEIFATRENFRQTIADYMQLEQMIRSSDVPPFDQVDDTRVHYLGVSLGGIMGSLFMPVEPDVRVGVLSVPGGALPRIIQSEAIGALIKPLFSLVTGVPLADPIFPMMINRFTAFAQWMIDPADPVNLAPFAIHPDRRLIAVPPKLILMHEGIVDTVIPNATTDLLAAAMGLPDANATRGCLSASGCSGLWRFVMSEYGFAQDSGHGVTFSVPEAQEQALHFIGSEGTEILDAAPGGED